MSSLNGIYRGVVVFNSYVELAKKTTVFGGLLSKIVKTITPDKKLRGKCKVWVAGVMPFEYKTSPAQLPWAEPAYGLFGTNNESGGVNSVPSVGSHVWVFFEEGDYMSPVYFLACQGGDGWVSEHVKQHTINTENVEITLDDDPSSGTKDAVLYIKTKGNVAINITGDVTTNIVGSVVETISGDITRNIKGNVTEIVNGNVSRIATGSYSIKGVPIIHNGTNQ